jgi:uncharacterized membrane protein YphA (DoxX/SURF4 family)
MNKLVLIARFFTGILFIISGLIKLNDPIGFSYKLHDYFAEDVLNFPALAPYALLIALFVVIFEVIVGVLLLLGYFKKFTLWSLFLMIVFFTFLTFYSAYFNKVTDCGCFGDALKLTPWQSFYKDVVLLVLSLFLLIYQQKINPYFSANINKLITFSGVFLCFYLAYYVLMHLPIIDFSAYKVGVSIPEGMIIPKDAPKPVYKDIWYYNVNGTVKAFTTEEQPWYIEGAEFTDRKTTLITKGYEPPIHDFSIEKDGVDYTNDVLNADKVILIIGYNLNISEREGLARLEALHQKGIKNDYLVIGLTGSLEEDIEKIKSKYHLTFDFYACDETTLKTIVRANPGVLILEKGTIMQKAHWNDLNKLNL